MRHLAAESKWLRYGVSAFLILWMGLFIVALTGELFSLHLLSTAKELVFITLPGAALGFAAAKVDPRFQGRLWPVFVGICLAQTIGESTVPGWIMNMF